jgi:hypothetical protein
MQYLIAERSWVWIMIELLLRFQATELDLGYSKAWVKLGTATAVRYLFLQPHPDIFLKGVLNVVTEYGCLVQSPHPTFGQGPIKNKIAGLKRERKSPLS